MVCECDTSCPWPLTIAQPSPSYLDFAAGFSIVLPTLWPYLRQMDASTEFLAAVVAAYSVGEGLGGLCPIVQCAAYFQFNARTHRCWYRPS